MTTAITSRSSSPIEVEGDFDGPDREMLENCTELCHRVEQQFNLNCSHYLLVSIAKQRLYLIDENKKLLKEYAVSTAAKGMGQRIGSGRTPLGLLFVDEKIGDKANPYAVFDSRKLTGEIANSADEKANKIVGRILWLSGAEEGYNRGFDQEGMEVDTKVRYIYIHGTNQISSLGKATSGGCIRMEPNQVVELFDEVPLKTPVYIYEGKTVKA